MHRKTLSTPSIKWVPKALFAIRFLVAQKGASPTPEIFAKTYLIPVNP
jgi:hypothetical protein